VLVERSLPQAGGHSFLPAKGPQRPRNLGSEVDEVFPSRDEALLRRIDWETWRQCGTDVGCGSAWFISAGYDDEECRRMPQCPHWVF
jgi:hypothetical protein